MGKPVTVLDALEAVKTLACRVRDSEWSSNQSVGTCKLHHLTPSIMWLSPKLVATDSPLPGFCATSTIDAGETLFTCPLSETLSTLTVYKSEWVKLVGGGSRTVKSTHLLAIYFLEMRALLRRLAPTRAGVPAKQEARDGAHTRTAGGGDDGLPAVDTDVGGRTCSEAAHPFAWLADIPAHGSDQIVTGLDFGPQAAAAARSFGDGQEQLDGLLAETAAAWEKVSVALDEVGVSEHDFRYGVSVVLSRSFEVEINGDRHHALVPVADAFNHCACKARSSIHFDDGAFEVVAPTPTASEGAHVYITYGPKSNTELLIGYGFALSDNRHDVATVRPPSTEAGKVESATAPPEMSTLLQHAMSCGPAAGLIGCVGGVRGATAQHPWAVMGGGLGGHLGVTLGWCDAAGGDVHCVSAIDLASAFGSDTAGIPAAIAAFQLACTDAMPAGGDEFGLEGEARVSPAKGCPGLEAAHLTRRGYSRLLEAAREQAHRLFDSAPLLPH